MQPPETGWKDIVKRTFKGLSADNASIVAAGVAFYAFLSIPAVLTTLVSLYGLVANPAQIGQQAGSLKGFVPRQALSLISSQLAQLSAHRVGTLKLSLVLSALFTLWSGTNGIQALIMSLNIAYQEPEKRGFLKLTALSVVMTLGAVLTTAIAVGLVVGISAAVSWLDLPRGMKTWIAISRWPFLAFIALASLAFAYRFAPSRERPRWRWISWGAMAATALWLALSALFSWYVASFGSYDKTYGSLSAIMVLLMWLYLTAYAILLGGKLNAEIERQSRSKDNDKDKDAGKPVSGRATSRHGGGVLREIVQKVRRVE